MEFHPNELKALWHVRPANKKKQKKTYLFISLKDFRGYVVVVVFIVAIAAV